MDVVAAGAANASGETEADGSEVNGATTKAVAYASVATARAEAKIHASVTAAATAHSGLGGCRKGRREGECRHGRQN